MYKGTMYKGTMKTIAKAVIILNMLLVFSTKLFSCAFTTMCQQCKAWA